MARTHDAFLRHGAYEQWAGVPSARQPRALSDDADALVLQPADLMTMRTKGERAEGRCNVSLRVSLAVPKVTAPRKVGPPRVES